MFAGDCPEHRGWFPYLDLQGRFPRGMQNGASWAETSGDADNYQGGSDYMTVSYEHLGFTGAWDALDWTPPEDQPPTNDPELNLEPGVGSTLAFAMQHLGFSMGNDVDLANGADVSWTENTVQSMDSVSHEMLPSYAYVQYCIKS